MSFSSDPFIETTLQKVGDSFFWECSSCGGQGKTAFVYTSDVGRFWEAWMAHLKNSHKLVPPCDFVTMNISAAPGVREGFLKCTLDEGHSGMHEMKWVQV